jgi:hypothetical protein
MLFRIEEHGGAEAVLAALAHEDLVVDAALASGPEFLVGGKLGIGNGLIAEVAVDLHHGQTGGEAEDLGVGVFFAAQLEDAFLDALGHAALAPGRSYDQARVGHIFALPGLNIAEAHPFARGGEGDNGLAFFHFLSYVFGTALGDAGATGFGRGLHLVGDGLCIHCIRCGGYPDIYLLLLHDILKSEVERITNPMKKSFRKNFTDRGPGQRLVLSESAS